MYQVQTVTDVTQERQRKQEKALEYTSNLIEDVLQQQNAHVASVTGADTSWPSVWHE